eukprot:jgi/Tetstr1/462339/TSEL_007345.t1
MSPTTPPFEMSGRNAPTAPKMGDAGKAAAFGGVETTATQADFTEAPRRKAKDIRLKQLIQEELSMFFTTQCRRAPASAGEEDIIRGGNESRAGGQDQNVRFGRRLEAIIHSMEVVDDGHRLRLAYLRKHRDTQMHHGGTFPLNVVRERHIRPGTENLGSLEFTELLELYKHRVYDANIASAAKTTACQRFGGALRRNDCDRDGSGGSRDNFKTTRPTVARGGHGATSHHFKGRHQ